MLNMPANAYHIYNRGLEARVIFNDHEDYEVFVGYLKGYITPAADPSTIKTTFTVNGKSFKGTPHQPKNYYGKIEILAYSLFDNHFHIVLAQTIEGSLEGFVRSLTTRYSIYFNKKYKRTG